MSKKATHRALPRPLNHIVAAACNDLGPAAAIRLLQGIVDVDRDGVLGPRTVDAVAIRDLESVVVLFCRSWVRGLVPINHITQ